MTVIEFIEYIGDRFSKNHEKSLTTIIESILNKKGWNILFIVLMIPVLIFVLGFIPFLLVLIGISLGMAFVLNGLLNFLLHDRLNYDYDKGKYYLEWIFTILISFSSIPLFFIALCQI